MMMQRGEVHAGTSGQGRALGWGRTGGPLTGTRLLAGTRLLTGAGLLIGAKLLTGTGLLT